MIPQFYEQFQKWGQQGAVWIFSDTHFGDEEIKKGYPNRPDDETLLKNINSCVGRKDTLILLGDVGDIEFARRIKGYKVLICGNHDKGATNYKREKVVKVITVPAEYNMEQVITEARNKFPEYKNWSLDVKNTNMPFKDKVFSLTFDNHLFDEVYAGPLIVGEKILLSHEPLDVSWIFNFHGHDHANKINRNNHFNCCADVVNYKPVNFNQLMKKGILSKVDTIDRITIDNATKRAKKRKNDKI